MGERQKREHQRRTRNWIIVGVSVGIVLLIALGFWLFHGTTRPNEQAANSQDSSTLSAPSKQASTEKRGSHASSESEKFPYSVPVPHTMYFALPNGSVDAPDYVIVQYRSQGHVAIQIGDRPPLVTGRRLKNSAQLTSSKTIPATLKEVPTKTIRVFNTDSSGDREVKVNTQIKLDEKYQPSDEAADLYYVFYNADGGISLAVVNYAGNVATKADTRIKAEYLEQQTSPFRLEEALISRGFTLSPNKYNGQDVDQAMNENKAPQNTVHDNTRIGYFKDAKNIRMTGLGTYVYSWDGHYTLTDTTLTIDSNGSKFVFPYTYQDGKLTVGPLEKKYSDGNVITWEFLFNGDGYQYVEGKHEP